jgi:Rps23 Pro-64 3,4-dihydroxylase Tpa1-like proline 4-hydroxylase
LYGGLIDSTKRNSSSLRDLGPLKDQLHTHFEAALPDIVAALRISAFVPAKYEIELVAHGDGAFFKPHIDTATGRQVSDQTDRVLSCVCYFHIEPKRYVDGVLRIHRIGASGVNVNGNNLDIVPECNMLVAFPSWSLHEVLPVSCPSNQFIDRRFAVNCWVHRARGAPRSP